MRKRPVQQRSQQVVEALIEATGHVIIERGLEHLTTIQVAARAGVSIGSLYQYFENKEQLVAALLDRLTFELGEVVNRTVPPLLSGDVSTLVRALLHAAFDFIGQKEGLYLELLRNWFRLDIGGSLHRFEQNMLDVTRAYVMTHAGRLRLANLPAKGFVIINSVVFTLLRYFSVPKQPLFSRQQVIDELTAMIAGYIAHPSQGRRTTAGRGTQPATKKPSQRRQPSAASRSAKPATKRTAKPATKRAAKPATKRAAPQSVRSQRRGSRGGRSSGR